MGGGGDMVNLSDTALVLVFVTMIVWIGGLVIVVGALWDIRKSLVAIGGLLMMLVESKDRQGCQGGF